VAIKNPALYALISAAPSSTPRKKRGVVEIRTERKKEFRLKEVVDRADAVLVKLEQRAACFADQIAGLQARKALCLARAEAIEDEILNRLAEAHLDRAAGWKRTLIAHPCPAAVDITNMRAIPAEYIRETVERKPDKVAIKAILSADGHVPGARLVQRITLQRK
jgi:hypothetical protein